MLPHYRFDGQFEAWGRSDQVLVTPLPEFRIFALNIMSQTSYGLLKGKKGIVFGPLDETSLGWQIALAAHREGAKLAVSNVAVALRVGKPAELAKLLDNAPLIQCDVSNSKEIEACFAEEQRKSLGCSIFSYIR